MKADFITAAEIHQRIGAGWPRLLEQLGVPEQYRRIKVGRREIHGPCPKCGGRDRYFFDNRHGRGDYYCRACGTGDGFEILRAVHSWDFKTARARVLEAAELGDRRDGSPWAQPPAAAEIPPGVPRIPPSRVRRLIYETCELALCPDAVTYLTSRSLWPMAMESNLRAHVGVDYFEDGQKAGRYPAIVAVIRDAPGKVVTAHVTYLDNGQKLADRTPRKLLSPLHDREACAVRLYRITGDSMGIAEGLETAIAARTIHDLPVWSALNTSLLAKFTPPACITRLVVFADRDIAGLTAAAQLLERLQGRVRVEIRTPPAPAKDWNDTLLNHERTQP